jgi:hypothetical protein
MMKRIELFKESGFDDKAFKTLLVHVMNLEPYNPKTGMFGLY